MNEQFGILSHSRTGRVFSVHYGISGFSELRVRLLSWNPLHVQRPPGSPSCGCRGKQAGAGSVMLAPLSVPGAVSPLSLNQTLISSDASAQRRGSLSQKVPQPWLHTGCPVRAGYSRLARRGRPREGLRTPSGHRREFAPVPPMAPRHGSGGRRVRRDDGDGTEPRRPFQVRSLVVCFPAAVCTGLVRKTREGGKGTEATCSPLQVRGLLR